MRKFLIRTIISIGILTFLFNKIEIKSLKELFERFNPILYIAAIIVMFCYQFLWAAAWKITLRQKNYNLRYRDIYRAILTSHFFGLFIPTTIGPDIVLTYNIGKALSSSEHAASSLLFIRSVNIFFNLTVSGIVLLFLPLNPILKHILITTWILVITTLICFWTATQIRGRVPFNFIRKILISFSEFGRHYPTLIKLSLLSILMSFIRVCIDYILALSLGIDVSYKWFLALIPSITIISTIPVSIGGLGIREGAYMGIFSNIGISNAACMSVSLLVFSVLTLISLVGGILYLIHGTHIKEKGVRHHFL